MTFDLKIEHLEKEVIQARDNAIEYKHLCSKLKKDIFVLEQELKDKNADIKEKNADIKLYRTEVIKLQEINDDLNCEYNKMMDELKYMSSLKKPNLRMFISLIWERVKYAYNYS